VSNLERLIKERFGYLISTQSSVILKMEDYFIPSAEKIQIIRDGDLIQVTNHQEDIQNEKQSTESRPPIDNHDSINTVDSHSPRQKRRDDETNVIDIPKRKHKINKKRKKTQFNNGLIVGNTNTRPLHEGVHIYFSDSADDESMEVLHQSVEPSMTDKGQTDIVDHENVTYTDLLTLPNVGDDIAFKVIEMSSDYTPSLSNFKEGKVLSITDNQLITVRLNDKTFILEKSKIEEQVKGKFSLDESPQEPIRELEINFNELVELKKINLNSNCTDE
jgi:hypothetical protein